MKSQPRSLTVAMSAMSAVLYAMGAYLTAYIVSPWGAGQFRPAVVIPSVFASLFGPVVGGLGAAVGTIMADSIAHGQIYVRSLVSAVPGNFVGFYLFGWLMKRRFTWANYVRVSQVTLLLSNTMVAFLYVYFRVFVDASYPVAFRDAWVYVSLGLVAWWYVTMLPFVLVLGPIVIRAVAPALSGFLLPGVSLRLKEEIPRKSLFLAMILPCMVMFVIGATLVTVSPALLIASGFASNAVILAGMQAMFLGSGLILLILSLLTFGLARPVKIA
jgi:hypothetical protein